LWVRAPRTTRSEGPAAAGEAVSGMLGKAVTVRQGAGPHHGEYFGRSKPPIVTQRCNQRQLQARREVSRAAASRTAGTARDRRNISPAEETLVSPVDDGMTQAHQARAAKETHGRRATYRDSIGSPATWYPDCSLG
jgi:hypothetical protein